MYTADVLICTGGAFRVSLTLLDEFIAKRVRLGVVIVHNFFQNVVKLVKFMFTVKIGISIPISTRTLIENFTDSRYTYLNLKISERDRLAMYGS